MYTNQLKREHKPAAQDPSSPAGSTTNGDSFGEIIVNVPRVLLRNTSNRRVGAELVSNQAALVVGMEELKCEAESMGLKICNYVSSGMHIKPGGVVASFTGNPLQVIRGEDVLLAVLGKACGIATAAWRAVHMAGRIKVVCGGWKKIPMALRRRFRSAVQTAGVEIRMLAKPFVYLDKNYIRIFGSLPNALQAARSLPDRALVIQLRGETDKIEKEAIMAAKQGSAIVMVDTGCIGDVKGVSEALKQEGLRGKVQIAFAGGIMIDDLQNLQQEDVDIVDIGRAILDAPLIDMRYDVVETEG